MDRRTFVRAAGAATAAAWTAPVIATMHVPAAAGTCCSSGGAVNLAPTCEPNTATPNNTCTTFFDSNASTPRPVICRSSRTQKMLLSRNAAGTQEPYFDELGVLTVTSPTNVVVQWSFIRWQADCAQGTKNVPLTSAADQQCSDTTLPAVDITEMFGDECGVFQLRLEVINKFSPYGWGTTWVVPVP
ncbi:MAG: hypothetical protein U0Q07_17175 [Acidimicrobiales bacterium]